MTNEEFRNYLIATTPLSVDELDDLVAKHKEEDAPSFFTKKRKIILGVYLFGCLLTFTGAPTTVMEVYAQRKLIFKPEPYFYRSLVVAAVELSRPFIAVFLFAWAIAIPILLPWGLWLCGKDVLKVLKSLIRSK